MNKGTELSLAYNKLIRDIIDELTILVYKSKVKSKNYDCNVVKVNIFNYVELGVLNGNLTFFDEDGYQYSLFCDCDIEDLIDILIAKTC